MSQEVDAQAVMSKLTERICSLVMENAILRTRLEMIEKELNAQKKQVEEG